ncbi:MAG: TAXI family TRAP transporter solute-binding subunit [Desulfobacteraceae bacterium]|nr:MAG: TAXI family TRAP transporter solute-binding subunit [Desulfobacteraceae bacterium]
MKKLFGLCVAVLFVIGIVVPVYAADTKLVLATGGTAGTYYPFGGAMARIWNTKIPGMNVTAQTTGASAENIRLVNKKEAELALVQSDTLDAAFNAKAPFTEAIKSMSTIAVLYPEIIQVVVRAESPIKSIADLKGKKVGVGAPGSGTEANFRQLMDVYGLAKDDVNSQYLSFSESAEAFKDRHIDAFIVTAGIPNAAIMDIGTQHAIRILTVPADMAAKLTAKYPFLAAAVVPAGTYKNQTQDVTTVAVNAVLIVGNDLSADVVYSMTKALFDSQAELASAHAKGKELNLKYAVQGVSIPFHPGALKYYKEKGVKK